MEFLDPKQKKSHNIKLFLGYAFMAAIVIAGTWLIAYLSSGYYYDRKTGQVVQNGLLFVDSHPESAQLKINGEDKGETDRRMVLPAGEYSVELSRDGYRSWKHDVVLEGGSIERLLYPFMFPDKLVTEDVDLYASKPIFASQSPDRRWVMAIHAESPNSYDIYDLAADSIQSKTYSFDTGAFTGGTQHSYKEVEWSTDNRHVLVRHEFDGKSEFLVVDREDPTKLVNLNTTFNREISSARFRDKKFDKYYFLDTVSGELVSGELSSAKINPVSTNVASFRPHGNEMLLIISRPDKTNGEAKVMLIDAKDQYVIRTLPKSSRYVLDLAQFDGKWYVTFGASEEKKAYIYIDPLNELKRPNGTPQASALLRLDSPIEYLSFSANTRFIAVQSGTKFAVYDAEMVRQFKYDTKLALPKGYQAKWMDGHRLTAVSDGTLVVFDFDGTNRQNLLSMYREFQPFFDRDYKKLFSVGPSVVVKGKSALTTTSMLYEPEKDQTAN